MSGSPDRAVTVILDRCMRGKEGGREGVERRKDSSKRGRKKKSAMMKEIRATLF